MEIGECCVIELYHQLRVELENDLKFKYYVLHGEMDLAKKYRNDTTSYTYAKHPFITSVIEEARKEQGST
ncbi:hypothetical protein GCM10008018_45050 [Paenibacillus marchantiophytorum]|uniref:Uncharacterized protein n=1 Tax=Paenibacillus marchantiophytorum TaxID=1619310 RepID=A0ABQ1EZH0_9BACL|nr:hypothetical protein GCM10008018_45050 [Paenibacillus marchantiophytorum]